jgi:hypothetical protein
MSWFVTAPLVSRPVTVRLYPLYFEHLLPGAVDVVFFGIAYLAWDSAGLPDNGWAVLPLFGVAVVAHVIQMALFVKVRFDDVGITIIRPWRRRRVAWKQVTGLVYTRELSSTPGPDLHWLRLVLTGLEPPYGRYLTDSQRERYARRGPAVMTVDTLTPDPDSGGRLNHRAAQCQDRVLTELERHGLTRPAPRVLAFQIRGEDPEQADLAIAADYLRMRDATRNAESDELN